MPLRKYRKQFNHLVNESDLLYRSFYDDCGKVKTKQFFVHKTLWREVIFHLYNSKTAGHFGIVKTVEEFWKRFCFPIFTNIPISSIRNRLSCVQLKRFLSIFLETPLQLVLSLTFYPWESLQFVSVSPLKAPLCWYVLTAVKVFSKWIFAVLLTNARAESQELTSMCF